MQHDRVGIGISIIITLGVVYVLQNGFAGPSLYILPPLFLLPFIAGPLAAYWSARLPARPPIEWIADYDVTVPSEHREAIKGLAAELSFLGFDPVGTKWYRSKEYSKRELGTVAIFQNPLTSDIATVSGLQYGAALTFTRVRSDSTRICTGFSTERDIFPPSAADSVMRIKGLHDPEWLWMLHCCRVSRDERSARNVSVIDPFSFYARAEFDAADALVASGYCAPLSDKKTLRLTLRGAILSSLRTKSPLAELCDAIHRQKVNSTLSEIAFPTQAEYRRRNTAKLTRPVGFSASGGSSAWARS